MNFNITKNRKNDKFDDIYTNYFKKIYILCLKILNNNAEDALDATQETFIQIFKSIDTLKDENKLNAWINKIAISKCSYIISKNKRLVLLQDNINEYDYAINEYIVCEEVNPEIVICDDERKKFILDSVNKLSEKKRIVILLYYYSDLKIEEISEILEIPVGTVKSRMNNAKKDLQGIIDKNKLYSTSLPLLLLLLKYDSEFKINKNNFKFNEKQLLTDIKKLRINNKININYLFKQAISCKMILCIGTLCIIIPLAKKVRNNLDDIQVIKKYSEQLNYNTYKKLTKTYPEIIGIEDKIIKKGDLFDLKEGVYVKDENNEISFAYVKGYVNVNLPGEYVLEYVLKDKLGNEVIKERKIIVK
ncbi:sigma-70 family RNA polymerase sigma factor [Clostridium sp.]|uniref:sigma-70 family RNA polymerase sigma factor n=1 Tax=Clostridium sp. TaxID=1506 RepID=UPI00262DA2CF